MFVQILVALVAIVLYGALYPTGKFDPLPNELTPPQKYEHQPVLANAEAYIPGALGPEHFTWDKEGNLYTGLENGTILKRDKSGKLSHYAHSSGRPLSLQFDKNGVLIVADARLGLLSVDKNGKVCILSNVAAHKGQLRKIGFTDFHVISPTDGTIYFTDASYKYDVKTFMLDFFEGRPHGSLLKYDPATGETSYVVKDEFYFANGLAFSQNEEFLFLAETFKARINKYYLKGPKAGTWEPFVEGLPGYPDNLFLSSRNTLWVPFGSFRLTESEGLLAYPAIKRILYRIPQSLHPAPKGTLVAEIDGTTGKILRVLSDPENKAMHLITSVEEHSGYLYIGTLHGGLHRYKL